MSHDLSPHQRPPDDLIELRLVLREKTSKVDKRRADSDLELEDKKQKLSESSVEAFDISCSSVDAAKDGSSQNSVALNTEETDQPTNNANKTESNMKEQNEEVSVHRKRSRKRKHLVEEPTPEEDQLTGLPNWACSSRIRFENRYEVGEVLAEGGVGVVCAGWRKSDNVSVAIKFVNKHNVEYTKIVAKGEEWKINEEVAMTARAAEGQIQPMVINLMDFYDLDTDAILILERPLDMVDLNKFIKDRGNCLTEELTRSIMKQVVAAAAHVLGNNIFHRDIKEHNILIQEYMSSPSIRIIDFSCSCFVSEEPYDVGKFAGTQSLAPPEVILGDEYRSGPTTVWQLGALMWQLTSFYRDFSTIKFMSKSLSHVGLLSKYAEDFLKICLLPEEKRATMEQLQQHPWLTY